MLYGSFPHGIALSCLRILKVKTGNESLEPIGERGRPPLAQLLVGTRQTSKNMVAVAVY